MKRNIELFVVGMFTYCAGAWVFIFYKILRFGQVSYSEPNRIVLLSEFSLALLLTGAGIAYIATHISGDK